jgi:hypothetical protein
VSPEQARALIGRRVRVHAGAVGLGDLVMDEGKVIGYAPHPSLLIEHDDGTQAHWMTTLPIKVVDTPTYLQAGSDVDMSVELHCRECYSGGRPLAWYASYATPNPYGDEAQTAMTIADLARMAAEHDLTHAPHPEGAKE